MKKVLLLLLLISNHAFTQVKTINISSPGNQIVNKPQHDPPETINAYTAVLAFDICTNSITVSDAFEFNLGDTVLMIQMKGAIIDTSNTPAFGTILDYGNAGNYEFNFISAKSGNTLTFLNKLTRSYDIPDGVVQLVRVPKYKNGYFSGGLTCNSWDGATGGIIAVYATTSVTSVEDIYVTGRGFRGAAGFNAANIAGNCNQNNYYYPASSNYAALRGESIGTVSQNLIKGKGNLAGGGGGGNSHNSGGGGGGNGGAGGHGGYQSDSCSAAPLNNGGVGGAALVYNSAINKIFMGSGGGAGHVDNAGATAPNGGNGGGIIIIITQSLEMFDENIRADGYNASVCGAPNCNDGNSGGGAGGTILLSYTSILGNLNLDTRGGKGANTNASLVPGGRAGPGGGGGGGVTFMSGNSFPANVNPIPTGGINGVIVQDANNAWGATAGSDGTAVFNLVIPYDTVLFKPNIDSVRIDTSFNYCNNILFKGQGYINTYPINTWKWYFGDGGTASTQDAVYNYNAVGIYSVKLVVTDINGCKDSITRLINSAGPMLAEAGSDITLCASGFISVPLNGSGTGTYNWTPAGVLNNNTLQNPIATVDTTTKFYLTVSNGTGCQAIDSVTITINKNPTVKTLPDTAICKNASLILTTNGAVNYVWNPGIYVSDSTIASPQFIDSNSDTLIVTGTGANGCKANDTIHVKVKTPVTFIAPPDKTICKNQSVQLNGNNGNAFQYLWAPALYLTNVNIRNPIAYPPFTTVYTVTITDKTCNSDSSFVVIVSVLPLPQVKATKSNDINCNKPFAQLKAVGAISYKWLPAASLNNAAIANPVANPAGTTKYFVTATDNSGCVNTDSITLIVNFDNTSVILPNSFTPNKDGINDCFGIKYYRDVQNLHFVIFNRFGEKVFETTDAAVCWNGYFKGQPADPGSYIYIISAKTLCGDVFKKGNLLLLR